MKIAMRTALAAALMTGAMCLPGARAQSREWPWLGVLVTDINRFNVQGYEGGGSGSYVTGVEATSPALVAGLLRHDIIVAVDGKTALNTRELTCLIQGRAPGDIVSVTVKRGGQRQSVTVRLGAWPATSDLPRPAAGNCGREPLSRLPGDQPETLAAWSEIIPDGSPYLVSSESGQSEIVLGERWLALTCSSPRRRE